MFNGRTIVVLCGSTRFHEAYQRANYEETMAGKIVLSVGHYPNAQGLHGQNVGCTPEQKVALDELHLDKVTMADEVLILDVPYPTCPVCGLIREATSHTICMVERFELRPYIGESTQRELNHARALCKRVRFWSEEGKHA